MELQNIFCSLCKNILEILLLHRTIEQTTKHRKQRFEVLCVTKNLIIIVLSLFPAGIESVLLQHWQMTFDNHIFCHIMAKALKASISDFVPFEEWQEHTIADKRGIWAVPFFQSSHTDVLFRAQEKEENSTMKYKETRRTNSWNSRPSCDSGATTYLPPPQIKNQTFEAWDSQSIKQQPDTESVNSLRENICTICRSVLGTAIRHEFF